MRVDTDLRNEKINYKIRELSLAKVPVILVVGKKEAEQGTVTLRRLGSEQQETIALADAIARLSAEARMPQG
jgi:threonyl-tRNA synthetase